MPASAITRRLHLPNVTLCAATSVNVAATIASLEASLAQVEFADCLLFTDADVRPTDTAIKVVPIPRISSAKDYSQFLLRQLAHHIASTHCLVAQWDGHIMNPASWDPDFLKFDYIGASWPQFDDGLDVGNGGFSLRSRRLLEICARPDFVPVHPEDVSIGRINRRKLEALGIKFAPKEIADRFATERAGDTFKAFGFHGVWLMPKLLGPERFWRIYCSLDDRNTIRHDLADLLADLSRGPKGKRRAMKMFFDRVADAIKKGTNN